MHVLETKCLLFIDDVKVLNKYILNLYYDEMEQKEMGNNEILRNKNMYYWSQCIEIMLRNMCAYII